MVKTGESRKNYTTIYVGLPPKMVKMVGDLVKKEGKTGSAVLRKIIDAYLDNIEKKGLPYEPLRKTSPVGLKILPRTIRRDQDEKLRELTEKTGRRISELVREAVEESAQ